MPMRSESDIQQDAMDELTWDAAVDARNLGVTVAGGVVTITGQVSAYAEKREAERLVEMIPGVRAVIVDIEVVPAEAASDAELGSAIRSALNWAAFLREDAVTARVKDGWVALSGTVHWAFQRQSAEDTVRYMKGVKGLTNDIMVANRGVPVGDIKTHVEAALKRGYDADAQYVQVSVNDRIVTLSGTVTDWWHRYLMRKAAWNAPGVEQVRDHMHIAA